MKSLTTKQIATSIITVFFMMVFRPTALKAAPGPDTFESIQRRYLGTVVSYTDAIRLDFSLRASLTPGTKLTIVADSLTEEEKITAALKVVDDSIGRRKYLKSIDFNIYRQREYETKLNELGRERVELIAGRLPKRFLTYREFNIYPRAIDVSVPKVGNGYGTEFLYPDLEGRKIRSIQIVESPATISEISKVNPLPEKFTPSLKSVVPQKTRAMKFDAKSGLIGAAVALGLGFAAEKALAGRAAPAEAGTDEDAALELDRSSGTSEGSEGHQVNTWARSAVRGPRVSR